MNAWNFGWKLALVANGTAPAALLGTYQAERQTVGRNVRRVGRRYGRVGDDRAGHVAVDLSRRRGGLRSDDGGQMD